MARDAVAEHEGERVGAGQHRQAIRDELAQRSALAIDKLGVAVHERGIGGFFEQATQLAG